MPYRITTETAKNLLQRVIQKISTHSTKESSLKQISAQLSKSLTRPNLKLNDTSQWLLDIFNRLFDIKTLQSGDLRPLVSVLLELPEVTDEVIDLLVQLKASAADNETIKNVIKLLDVINSQAQKETQHLPIPARAAARQSFVQSIRQFIAIVDAQSNLPPSVRISPQDLALFFNHAWNERPAAFQNELFSLPVLQRNGFTLNEYLSLAEKVNPLRLSLTLIAFEKIGTSALKSFIANLRNALQTNQSIEKIVEQAIKRYQIKEPASFTTDHARFLYEGIATLPTNKNRAISVQAVSRKLGLLPDDAWTVLPNAENRLINGALLYTISLPVGLHRLTFKVKDGDEEEAIAEFLCYMLFGLSEEEEKEERNPKERSKKERRHSFTNNKLLTSTPVGGELTLTLNSPFILMHPFNSQSIPAPIQVHFQFLSTIIQPQYRWSRDHFLTLHESVNARLLRGSIHRLHKEGLKGVGNFLQQLNGFFNMLTPIFPHGEKSLEQAKRYLRNAVLLYFMGKSPETMPAAKLIESSTQGDVIASLCATTSQAMSLCGEWSNALIQFADATKLADHQHYFKWKFEQFLQQIREYFSDEKTQSYKINPPLLPPTVNDTKQKSATPNADLFLKHYRTE